LILKNRQHQSHLWVLQSIDIGSSTGLWTAADCTLLRRCGEAKGDHNQRSWVDQNSSTTTKCRYVRHWFISLDPSSLHFPGIQTMVGGVERAPILLISPYIPWYDWLQVQSPRELCKFSTDASIILLLSFLSGTYSLRFTKVDRTPPTVSQSRRPIEHLSSGPISLIGNNAPRGRPGRSLGRKGGGVGPAAPAPFLFFFWISFLQNSSKFIWTNLKSFSPLAPKSKIVPKQKPYNFVLISKTKFQREFELQIKTSSRFLNKFNLGIFV